jgi:formylmethanofuran dehydrogenase subunit E
MRRKRENPEIDRLLLEGKLTAKAIAKQVGVHMTTVYNRKREILPKSDSLHMSEDGSNAIRAANKRVWKDPKKRKRIIAAIKKSWKDPVAKAERMAKIKASNAERRRTVHALPIDIKCDRCGIVLGISRRETRIVCLACVSQARSDLLKTEFDTP